MAELIKRRRGHDTPLGRWVITPDGGDLYGAPLEDLTGSTAEISFGVCGGVVLTIEQPDPQISWDGVTFACTLSAANTLTLPSRCTFQVSITTATGARLEGPSGILELTCALS